MRALCDSHLNALQVLRDAHVNAMQARCGSHLCAMQALQDVLPKVTQALREAIL